MRILLIEDDPLVGDALVTALTEGGMGVDWCRDGTDAEAALLAGTFELVVLDLSLPGLDGLAILRGLRARGSQVPVLIVTARDGVDDRIAGLDHGADDYMIKPFDMGELKARARALTRRAKGRVTGCIELSGLRIDPAGGAVTLDGQPVLLRRKEFRLLSYLAEHQGRVVPRARLEEVLYGWEDGAESNTIEVYVSTLRRRIGAARIRTLRGIGYMMP